MVNQKHRKTCDWIWGGGGQSSEMVLLTCGVSADSGQFVSEFNCRIQLVSGELEKCLIWENIHLVSECSDVESKTVRIFVCFLFCCFKCVAGEIVILNHWPHLKWRVFGEMFEQPLGKEGAVVRVCESVGTLATAELASKGRNGGRKRWCKPEGGQKLKSVGLHPIGLPKGRLTSPLPIL